MKIKSQFSLSTSSRRMMKVNGFALIVSLTLMVLLALIVLGLLSLSASFSRTTNQDRYAIEARANARLAISIALGELQKAAGSDQRATAPSDQLSITAQRGAIAKTQQVNQKNWLGVWSTVQQSATKPGFLIGRYDSGTAADNYLVDLREPTMPASGDGVFDATRATFSEDGLIAWMVSQPLGNSTKVSPTNFVPSDESVVIYGKGWQDDALLKDHQVSVPLVKIDSANSGGYAYWVSDESMKANLAVVSRHGSDKSAKTLAQTSPADLVDAQFTGHQDLIRGDEADLAKLITFSTTSLISGLDGASDSKEFSKNLKKFGHDFTVKSTGLLTNPQTGGFQQDLSAFLALPNTLSASTYAAAVGAGFQKDTVSGAPGLKIGDPIVLGPRHTNTSPRFGALKAWADLSKVVSGSGAEAAINVQLPMSRAGAVTDVSGTSGTAGHLPDITKIAPQAVHPIMTECSLGWDFSQVPGTAPQGLRVHIFPKVVLWNPYNVTLNAASYLVLMKLPNNGVPKIDGKRIITANNTRFTFRAAVGNPVQDYVGFVTEATAIPPGEALVFTARATNATGTLGGQAVLFNPLDYSKNVLSCRQMPASEDGVPNFYRELLPATTGAAGTVWHWDTDGTKKPGVPAVDNAIYGFGNNSNDFFAQGPASADQYILKALPGNSIPGSLAWSQVSGASTASQYPALQFMIAQPAGLNRYDKWWAAGYSNDAVNGGNLFSPFSANSRPPRLWRRGLKLREFNDYAEYQGRNNAAWGTNAFNVNWTAEYNLRAGLVHTAWLGASGNYARALGDRGPWYQGDPGSYIFMWSPRSLLDGTDQPILSGENYCVSPFGTTQSMGGSTSFPLFEIPRNNQEIASIAQFQNAQLSYQSYHTTNVVGHSLQVPSSERAATVVRPNKGGVVTTNAGDHIDSADIWNIGHDLLIQNQNSEILLYDMPFEVNNRLFDNFFLSGIKSTWDTESALPNDRLRVLTSSTRPLSLIKSKLNDHQYLFHQAGSFLGNEGAFNVNSTSIPAWTAQLSALRDLGRDAVSGTASGGSWFSRMQNPVLGENASGKNVQDPAAWAGVAALSDAQISTLATTIVAEVKLRGPFISLSDFINRRLVEPPSNIKNILYEDPNIYSLEATGRMGALDAAIVKAGINSGLTTTPNASSPMASRFASNERAHTAADVDKGYYVHGSQPDQKTTGMLGSLSQGDLLSALAPTLTARGDTFTIRAYGDARDPAGKVLAKAWCEVIVQRTPDYVDNANDPSVRALIPVSTNSSDPTLQKNPALTEVNHRFGRKFRVISFRWLDESEI